MLKNAFTAILFLATVNCLAQQTYFVSIQADNNQSFYAQLDGKVFSSSDMGHLIIPQLKDSSYHLLIRFPKNSFAEEQFNVVINKKDQSFQLKNMGEKGWALFNTLANELQVPIKADTSPKPVTVEPAKKEDAFARLMAGVVNDTSVMHHTVVEEDEPKKVVEMSRAAKAQQIRQDTIAITKAKTGNNKAEKKPVQAITVAASKAVNNVAKTDTLSKAEKPLYRTKDTVVARKNLSFVKVLNEQKTDTALQMKYVDIPNKGPIDTVDILIPFSGERNFVASKKEVVQKLPEEVSNKGMNALKVKDTVRALMNGNTSTIKKSTDSIKTDTAHATETKIAEAAMNKNCKSFAIDNDIDKLRVQMLAIENDDDKISTARLVFKFKCFSVKQVRALSEVFKTDEGKYKFFDATYLYVSDVGDFIQLQSLLSDAYYINRFKAMIR